jgi:RNA methyltransferase, TrmH family
MITSRTNPKLRYVRQLARRSFRQSEGRLPIEGVRLVEEALDAGCTPAFALWTVSLMATERGQALHERLQALEVPLMEVAPGLLADLADTVAPQGVITVIPIPEIPLSQAPDLILVLDGLQDPGNLGTALRSALAAGVNLVLLAPGTVDSTSPKVIRAGMGAHFRLPIRHADWPSIGDLTRGLAVWTAHVGATRDYAAVDWRVPSALVVSSEAHGPSPGARAMGEPVCIPLSGPMESLNAATAAAVILFEAQRQRRGQASGG